MPHFFLKIFYLVQHKATLKIIFNFILFQIQKPLFNTFRSNKKREFIEFVKRKKITHNFFSKNSFDWLKNLKNRNINDYLEIGSFEGVSILFINKNFKPKNIHAVDTWGGSNEYGKEVIFTKVEKNYKFNTKGIKNIKNFKMTSDIFFKRKNIKYDLIYIDGLHTKKQVTKDLNNALKLSKKDTVIICDDFFWKFDKKFTKNLPAEGIIPVIKKNNLKIISVTNNQIFLEK